MLDTSEPIYADELTDLAAAIEPRPRQSSHAKRAALVVKTGRLALSPGAVAWICSISIHAVVFGAGIWIVTSLVHHARLPIDWGGGGGSSGGLVSGQTQSQIAAVPLPGALPTSVDPTPDRPREEITVDAEFHSDPKTSIDLGGNASTAGATIGMAETSNIGQPHFNGRRPPAGASGGANKNDDTSTVSGGDIGDSGPGLPGSLIGSGIPAPDYPAESKRLGEQGTVRVAIEVLADGAVGRIYVASDPGYPRLRDASLKAAEQLRRYKLMPAVKGGKPLAEVIVVPYKFKLR